MNSNAYVNLQNKLALTGREYFDGFDEQDFYRLTDRERSEICDILKARSRQGDSVALRGLNYVLSASEFLAFAEGLLAARPKPDPMSAELLTEIFKRTGRDDIFTKILDLLMSADVHEGESILDNLTVATLTKLQRDRLAALLINKVQTEISPGLLLSEVVTLLNASGFTPGSAEFIRLAEMLRSRDQAVRKRALDEIARIS
jgi:hypothetical protein